MKRRLKSALFCCLYYSGIEWLLAKLVPARAVAILMYHGVCDDPPIPAHINFHVDRAVFARHMKVLKRRYRVLPLAEVAGQIAARKPLGKAVVITFDDGYRNNATHAVPVLQRLGLPATIFVVTDNLASGEWLPLNRIYWEWSRGGIDDETMSRLRKELRTRPAAERPRILADVRFSAQPTSAAEESFAMLNWTEARELQSSGMEIASHTCSHCNLAIESPAQQEKELAASKRQIESEIGVPVTSFAYPYGYLSPAARNAVFSAGYRCAVSTEYALATAESDPYALPRLATERPVWMFACEILYRFLRHAVGSARDAAPTANPASASRDA